MVVQLTAKAVRSRAKRAGVEKALNIRTGRAAQRAEHCYVPEHWCSVRVAVLDEELDKFLDSLPEWGGGRQ